MGENQAGETSLASENGICHCGQILQISFRKFTNIIHSSFLSEDIGESIDTEIFSPPVQENDQTKLPSHEFSYKLQYSAKKGFSWSASLIIAPYVYTTHTKTRTKVLWHCTKCKEQDCSTYARSEVTFGPDGKPSYVLKSYDSNHVCNPCPSYHLLRLFRDRLSIVSTEDLLMTFPEAYEKVKNEMLKTMDPALQNIFLQKLPSVSTMASHYTRPRKFLVERKSSSDNFVCELCSYEANDIALLRKHRNNKHQDEIKKSHKCETCGKTFLQQENLAVHLKNVHNIHSDDLYLMKSFACDQCGHVFLSKIKLKKHFQAVHLKLTPFECDICQKRFGMSTHLSRHKKTVHKKYLEESAYI